MSRQITQSPNETFAPSAVLDTIHERRSVRDGFINGSIDTNLVENIVHAGLVAPSSKNAQPWKLHVVHQGDLLHEIADAVQYAKSAPSNVPINPTTGEPHQWRSTVIESAQVLKKVGVSIFVENEGAFSGSRNAVVSAAQKNRKSAIIGYTFEAIGIGAMIQNMWITARLNELEGVFMGDVISAEKEIKSKLGMTGDLIGVLALGHTKKQTPKNRTLKPGSVMTHNYPKEHLS